MTLVPQRQISGIPEGQFQDAAAEQLKDIILVIDSKLQFGDPQDPYDPSSATLAGDTAAAGHHNGTSANIDGSWVEAKAEATGASVVTFTHNLNIDNPQYAVPVTGEPNVRWLVFGWTHDGDGVDGTSGATVNVGFINGDTVVANSIDLRVSVATVGTAITINATHPLILTLFFTRATRGQ
jgi:hypothetical protein